MTILQSGAIASTGGGGFQIERSLRFNSADSAHLNRTLGTSNRRTFTFSAWLKRSVFASTQCIFGNINYAGGGSTNQQFYLGFTGSDQLDMFHYNNGTQNQVTSSAVYRDPSAWYHIVGAVDTTQATSSNRLKIYVNGSQITALATATYPAQNTDTFINANLSTGIGRQVGTGISGSYYNDGYLTEIYFIDGQALTPSDFGETDSATGVWKPKAFSGTYGTNGFYLKFADNSGTTSTTLGKDSSGNGNNWTPNNFSVTAGAGNDSLVDSPTSYGTDTGVGGEVRGNYSTLNPLFVNNTYPITYSNGNLNATRAGGGQGGITNTFGMSSGKWYWEVVFSTYAYNIGITTNPAGSTTGSEGLAGYNGGGGTSIGLQPNGVLRTNGTAGSTYTSWTVGDIMGIALDMDGGNLYFYKNGTAINSGNPVATSLTGSTWFFITSAESGLSLIVNFGQRPFAYTAPSGFKALCTQNLPTPTIGATSTTQANKYMDVTLYTGNATARSITNSGSMQPDFVWDKLRSGANSHRLFDAVRGVEKALYSNLSNAETTETGTLTAFNSNGFSLGTNNETNTNGSTYVAWQWNAGGSNATNTSGTITSTVRANTTSGFSIGTYDATGANGTIGHGLGAVPKLIIIKNRFAANSWVVYHSSVGNGKVLLLNSTNGETTDATAWNNTTPTSTVFSVGTGAAADTNQTNASANDHIFFAFAEVAGYSAFGSYTGNGSADGPFIYTGFKPNFVMVKQTNTSGNSWWMFDGVRSPTNAVYNRLAANLSDAEYSNSSTFDFLSNGFKLRFSDTAWNGSGSTYIYAAFAETPAKFSLAR